MSFMQCVQGLSNAICASKYLSCKGRLLSLSLCNELMVDLPLVLFLQQRWVCQQQVFGCVWEPDNSR